MMIVLYILFGVALFCPIYTYCLYPCVLRMMKSKGYKRQDITPTINVVIVGDNAETKINNIHKCPYLGELVAKKGSYENNDEQAIIIFTDTVTELDLAAVREIVKPFADERVGCVVGQQTNPKGNSIFWKYENKVKMLESRIGCVSGATESLFAVRKSDMPEVPSNVLNKPFYIATKIMENRKAVVFQETAKAYEGATEGTNFRKHVKDAVGYWQALSLFPRMLGSFVYISHRVMKWFVWLNMMTMLVSSGMLGLMGSVPMLMLFDIQVVGYAVVIGLGRKKIGGPIGKLLGIGYYFVMLNVAYFVGLFYKERVV